MTIPQIVNLVLSATATLVVGALLVRSLFFETESQRIVAHGDGSRWQRLTGVGHALWLWGCWWLALFVSYALIAGDHYSALMIVSAIGDLATLGASVAFCRGSRFRVDQLVPLGLIVCIVIIWALVTSRLTYSPEAMLVAIGPSAVLSAISIVALGWAVVVRCGWWSSPFAVFTLLYAFAQPAAYVRLFVLEAPVLQSVTKEHFAHLDVVFWFLALGKIVMALSFLGYLFSPSLDDEELAEERFVPRRSPSAEMHPFLKAGVKWIGGTLAGLLIALVVAAVNKDVVDFLRTRVFNLPAEQPQLPVTQPATQPTTDAAQR